MHIPSARLWLIMWGREEARGPEVCTKAVGIAPKAHIGLHQGCMSCTKECTKAVGIAPRAHHRTAPIAQILGCKAPQPQQTEATQAKLSLVYCTSPKDSDLGVYIVVGANTHKFSSTATLKSKVMSIQQAQDTADADARNAVSSSLSLAF